MFGTKLIFCQETVAQSILLSSLCGSYPVLDLSSAKMRETYVFYPEEFMALNDHTAFLVFEAELPRTQITLNTQPRSKRATPLAWSPRPGNAEVIPAGVDRYKLQKAICID
jgi:hypothetical protein